MSRTTRCSGGEADGAEGVTGTVHERVQLAVRDRPVWRHQRDATAVTLAHVARHEIVGDVECLGDGCRCRQFGTLANLAASLRISSVGSDYLAVAILRDSPVLGNNRERSRSHDSLPDTSPPGDAYSPRSACIGATDDARFAGM